MDKIRIGIDNLLSSECISDQLKVIEEKVEVKRYRESDISISLLEREIIDLLVIPLKKVPTSLPEGLVIAGLTPRIYFQDVLCIRSESVDKKKTLRLKDQSVVGTNNNSQYIQLKSMRHDLNIKNFKEDARHFMSSLENGKLDAFLIPESDLSWMKISLSDYFTIKMHPSELVPTPGEGTLSFISFKDNIALRRLITSIHHKETALCTNVERRLLKRFGSDRSDIGAYCYRDSAGFFHAYASMKDQKENAIHVSCSQSTHLELDSKLYDLLIQKA
ncbi:MAG: hypothetical protein HKN68_20380 [Saprospiraceae bacterium]|nr:hypothetical protein [Saprospiraceae bacterium]